MPLLYDKVVDTEGRICVWEITESLQELLQISKLSKDELEKTEKKTPKRLLEWLTIRTLIRHILTNDERFDIYYDEYGKPHLKEVKRHISISHTKQFVAVFLHPNKHVGIDIEIVTPRIQKIEQRFLNTEELNRLKDENRLEQLYVLWGAKECAFKIYSEGGIDFKEMLEVKKFEYVDKGKTSIALKKNKMLYEFTIWWEKMNSLMIVYSMGNS